MPCWLACASRWRRLAWIPGWKPVRGCFGTTLRCEPLRLLGFARIELQRGPRGRLIGTAKPTESGARPSSKHRKQANEVHRLSGWRAPKLEPGFASWCSVQSGPLGHRGQRLRQSLYRTWPGYWRLLRANRRCSGSGLPPQRRIPRRTTLQAGESARKRCPGIRLAKPGCTCRVRHRPPMDFRAQLAPLEQPGRCSPRNQVVVFPRGKNRPVWKGFRWRSVCQPPQRCT